MVKILVFGDQADDALSGALYHYLTGKEKKILTLSITGGTGKWDDHLIGRTGSWDYLIVDSERADVVAQLQPDIFIFKENHTVFKKPYFSSSVPKYLIFSAGDALAYPLLHERKTGLIPCGLSEKDTITFSSIEQNSGCVSLQRALENLAGEIVEPCEIKFSFATPFSYYHTLAFAALLLLMEDRERLPVHVEISVCSE